MTETTPAPAPTANETTGEYLTEYKIRLEKVGTVEGFNGEFLTAGDLEPLCRRMIGDCDREYLIAVALGPDAKPVAVHTVSIGTLTAALGHPRETFKFCIHTSAHAVVLAHNHPSPDVTPSGADLSVTKRMIKAGKLIGIPLLGSLIIGRDGNWSDVFDHLQSKPKPPPTQPDQPEPSEPPPEPSDDDTEPPDDDTSNDDDTDGSDDDTDDDTDDITNDDDDDDDTEPSEAPDDVAEPSDDITKPEVADLPDDLSEALRRFYED